MHWSFFLLNDVKRSLFNRLRAFRRAKILDQWIVGFCVCYVCGFAGLWFVDLLCFLASWVYGLTVFEKKSWKINAWILTKITSQIGGKSFKIHQKLVQNPSKINKNRPKSRKMRPWDVFGANLRPGRLQDARCHSVRSPPWSLFGRKGHPGDRFGNPGKSEIGPKTHFWV